MKPMKTFLAASIFSLLIALPGSAKTFEKNYNSRYSTHEEYSQTEDSYQNYVESPAELIDPIETTEYDDFSPEIAESDYEAGESEYNPSEYTFQRRLPSSSSSSNSANSTGGWTSRDIRNACDEIVEKMSQSPALAAFYSKNHRKPRVSVGSFINKSSPKIKIDASVIADKLQESIEESSLMEFYAAGSERKILQNERRSQHSGYVSEKTAVPLNQAKNAEFLLTGTVNCMVQESGNRGIRTYMVHAQLTDIRTNAIIWKGSSSDINKEYKISE